MRVTYWAFEQQFSKVLDILSSWEEKPEFVWPLVKEHLRFARCFISGAKVSFSFPCLPVEVLPSFCDAKRRIYLTATLARDEILVWDLGAESAALSSPLSPQQVSDLGDRMIVVPQIKNIELTDDELRKFVKGKSLELNCVVIVPSHARAQLWKEHADEIVDASNLQPVVSRLRSERVGLVVLVNKYDGVDLPGDACRILVLDDLPSARGLSSRYEDSVFKGSTEFRSRLAHRIEQGMGRGIRAADDFCAVMLMGSRLVDFLNDPRSIDELRGATHLVLAHHTSDVFLSRIRRDGLAPSAVTGLSIQDRRLRRPGDGRRVRGRRVGVTAGRREETRGGNRSRRR